mgnify:FL=1
MMYSVKIQEILDDFFIDAGKDVERSVCDACAGVNVSDIEIRGFASLEKATSTDISFWTGNAKSITNANGFSVGDLSRCEAGVLLVPEGGCELLQGKTAREIFPKVRCLLPVKNPYHAMVCFLEKHGAALAAASLDCGQGGASGCLQKRTAPQIDPSAEIGPGCVVMPGAVIGARCRLEANVVIYPNVVVGEDCIFQAGAVVGSRGFGFYEHQGNRRMVPHFAGVRIGDRCSFGANTVVAAGFISPTTIGNDCHFDAMVQIGHNCILGNDIYMAAQTALGGSTVVEDGVSMAGGAKAAGHLTIGKGAVVTAKAGVTKSVPAGRTVAGFPAVEAGLWRRSMVYLRQMGKSSKKK